MYKRDGVVRLSQSTVPKYGVNVHNVRVHLIDISLHEIFDSLLYHCLLRLVHQE